MTNTKGYKPEVTGRSHLLDQSDLAKQVAGVNRPPSLKVKAYVTDSSEISTIFTEYHMTIVTRVTTLSAKQASMLLSLACYKAVTTGVDITLYMAIDWLSTYLHDSEYSALNQKNEKVRHTLLCAELVQTSTQGNWFTLSEREELPEEVIKELVNSGWLPKQRTVQSWKNHWNLEKYLQVKIVPVDTYRRRKKVSTAERYSAYTRGYGNDGSPPAPGRTRRSTELDGENTPDDPPEITLSEFETYITILNAIEREKTLKNNR